jgi:hypothetical protein
MRSSTLGTIGRSPLGKSHSWRQASNYQIFFCNAFPTEYDKYISELIAQASATLLSEASTQTSSTRPFPTNYWFIPLQHSAPSLEILSLSPTPHFPFVRSQPPVEDYPALDPHSRHPPSYTDLLSSCIAPPAPGSCS